MPARNRTINNIISNNALSNDIDPPIKANGIEPIKYGHRSFILMFPDLRKFTEFPETTITLQIRAIIGKM